VSELEGGNRVLIWNSIPTQNGQPADVVLGQPDFDSWEPFETSSRSLLSPRGVEIDPIGRLYVNDGYSRILIWNSIPTSNFAQADVVVGQPDFEANFSRLTREGLDCGEGGVTSDGTHLFIADRANSRVIIHNEIPTQNGRPADVVLGQPDFTTNRFISRVGIRAIKGIASDGTRLFLSQDVDGRILIHNILPAENNRPANVVLGQPDFDTVLDPELVDPRAGVQSWDIFSDGAKFYAADTSRNRVLIWNSIPTTNYASADVVLGQPDFTSETPGAGRSGLNFPLGITSDGRHFIVADVFNNRVLIWNEIPTQNAQPADVVVGQPDFDSTEPGIGAAELKEPFFVTTDGVRLFVSDLGNFRVLIWNTIPTTNGQPADVVLGAPDFTSMGEYRSHGIFSDGTHLFLVDQGNARVLIWNSIPTTNDQPPDVVLGQPDFESRWPSINRDGLFFPFDLTFDGVHLWVSETKFSDRVVRFSILEPRAVILKAPTNVKASSITLNWHRSTLANFARYEVHGSETPGFTPSDETLLAEITDITATSHTASGLSLGTTYYFRIRTYDTTGAYSDSVQRFATTLSAEVPTEEIQPEKISWLLYAGIGIAIVLVVGLLVLLKRR
jgi:hypothetical protein